ncbi:endo-1,4-beta-xylanase [Wenyingzhuangia sp. 1_MG-2023]|nr:endo-1,4-beta-xylanase [Wenyingzhuangia sp. 1_MG-2023]
MVNKFKFLGIFVLLLTVSCTEEEVVFVNGTELEEGTTVDTEESIKDKASFNIGGTVKTSQMKNDSDFNPALTANFNQITAEFEMKMENIWTASDTYNWEAADYLVDFAENNDMEVHGHVLLWYNSIPNWLANESNDSIVFEAKIKSYITEVVTRYKGKIKSWDVVNEVFEDNGSLRSDDVISPLFTDLVGFYVRCFQYVRDVDPDAELFYNDYSIVVNASKRNAIKNIVIHFKAEGYPIDGIGAQFHYTKTTSLATIKTGFTDIASTGLLMHISELDMVMNSGKLDGFIFSSSAAQEQSDIYQGIVEMYNNLPENQKFAITTWGVSDKYTWLKDFWHPRVYPLLLDENYNKKKAYQGFLNGLD